MKHEFSIYDQNDKGPTKFGPRRLYKGGGGGTSTTTPTIPDELKPLANLYTQQATNIANTPYQAYTGAGVLGMNGTQNQALQMIKDRAVNGNELANTGSSYLQNMLQSGPQGATQNPYGQVSAGQNTSTVNPGWNSSYVNPGQNKYAGSNPYLQQNIDAALNDVTRSYNNTVKPAQTNAVVGSGSFGNSGLAQTQAEQERQLAATLGNVSSSMRMQDYGNQQQLAESGLNRGMQAQQFNAGLNDTNLGRSMQAQQFNSGVTDSNLNRNFQAQTTNANLGNDWAARNDSQYNNYRNQNLSAAQLAPTYANQAYTDAGQLLNAGNAVQNNAQNQADFAYQQFQNQQNYPYKQLQATGGVVGQNMGSTTTQTAGGK